MQEPPNNNYMLAWSINNTEIDSWRKMNYLNYKEVKRLKEYNKISHYYKMTKGWVAKRYEEEHPTSGACPPQEDTLNFEDVTNKAQAITFINSIPKHLRFDNQEITFLMFEYNIKQEELE